MGRRILGVMVSTAMAALVSATVARAAELHGKVRMEASQAPSPKRIRLDADPKCKAAHPAGLDDDHYRVDGSGDVADAVVYVRKGLPKGATFPTPAEPVTLDQVGCRYVPKVFGIQTKQRLRVVNSDDTLHNVHAIAKRNPGFNIGMPVKGMVNDQKSFGNPEVAVRIKCDVHPWMAAYAAVLPHPFFSVSGADGTYTIPNLPAGDYTIEVWHARLGRARQEIHLGAEESKTLDFSIGGGRGSE